MLLGTETHDFSDPCRIKKCIAGGQWVNDSGMPFALSTCLNHCSNVIAKVVCNISSGLSHVREASLGQCQRVRFS